MAKKVIKEEVVKEKVAVKEEVTPAPSKPEGYDHDLPDNKQRWLRE